MKLGYAFHNPVLLKTALTHISYANERSLESNQRLEFLGDSVLSFIIAETFYHRYPNYDEGRLTQMRAAAVCEKTLAAAARKLKLADGIYYGKSELNQKKDRASILADTYEAVLAAIYLDGGMDVAREWVLRTLGGVVEEMEAADVQNYKSEIQYYYQKRDKGRDVVTYRLVKKAGPDHAPVFDVQAVYRGEIIGQGTGGSRKQAEQAAAKMALERLGVL